METKTIPVMSKIRALKPGETEAFPKNRTGTIYSAKRYLQDTLDRRYKTEKVGQKIHVTRIF